MLKRYISRVILAVALCSGMLLSASPASAASAEIGGEINRHCELVQYPTYRTGTNINVDFYYKNRIDGGIRLGLRDTSGKQFTTTRQIHDWLSTTVLANYPSEISSKKRFAMNARCVSSIPWNGGWLGLTWGGTLRY
ncbi:hypothetical protein [Streptomyces sp. enrichment culture]|uniref:hypothetical protein n=1 Tax=Streptomyces sp. enrichment culture TaxID=1795815 RepID=UPI003F564B73